jgi:hypothetical protein
MTSDPYPAAGPAHPVALNPHSPRARAYDPGTGNPFVARSGPTPVTSCPNVPRPGRNRLGFDPNSRRSLSHNNFSSNRARARARSRNLLGSCRRCHCCRFLGAADEEKRGQHQCINTFSHLSLLLVLDSFCTTPAALFESAITIFLCAQSMAKNKF